MLATWITRQLVFNGIIDGLVIGLLAMGIVAWNVPLFPVGERALRLRELSTTLPAEARTDFLALIREMIARKERYFAQNTRYILNYELTEGRESYHLNVLSTLLPPPQVSADAEKKP